MRSFILAGALVLAATGVHAATYEKAACPVAVAADEKIECGKLTVPENRNKPGSRTITLSVEIFRSRSATPAPDPVIFLPGGPGGSATRQKSGKNNPFLDDRDYILLEPRGAAYSSSPLNCPEINAIKGEIAAGHHAKDADAVLTQAAAKCRADLTTQVIDLDGYTSAETADDIDDLRQALGIKQWNVFGHSYGTRLALTYLRDHPDGVRSVILDSVLPPEADFDESASANLTRALNAVFDGCRVNPACARAYPSIAGQFYSLVDRTTVQPLTLTPAIMGSDNRAVIADGAVVVDAIYSALHNPGQIGQIPAIIADANNGKTDRLAALIKDNQGPSNFTWGLRLSIWCGEEMPFEDSSQVEDQTSPGWGLGGIDERTASVAMCKAWNVAAADPRENLPVKSDVPVLVLSGEFDPDTPPQWARAMAANLTHARFVLMPGQTHGAGFNRCGGTIEPAFLRDPSAPLDTTCVLTMPTADFTPAPSAPLLQ